MDNWYTLVTVEEWTRSQKNDHTKICNLKQTWATYHRFVSSYDWYISAIPLRSNTHDKGEGDEPAVLVWRRLVTTHCKIYKGNCQTSVGKKMRTGPTHVSCASKSTVRNMVMNNVWWNDGLYRWTFSQTYCMIYSFTKSILQTITCYLCNFERGHGQKFDI